MFSEQWQELNKQKKCPSEVIKQNCTEIMENSLFLFRKEKTKQAGYKIKIMFVYGSKLKQELNKIKI